MKRLSFGVVQGVCSDERAREYAGITRMVL